MTSHPRKMLVSHQTLPSSAVVSRIGFKAFSAFVFVSFVSRTGFSAFVSVACAVSMVWAKPSSAAPMVSVLA